MNRPEQENERLLALQEAGLTPEDCQVSEVQPNEWLESPEDFALYLDEALATGDARYIAHCLGNIAKVVGATLPENMMPNIESLLDMLRGINVQLHANEKR